MLRPKVHKSRPHSVDSIVAEFKTLSGINMNRTTLFKELYCMGLNGLAVPVIIMCR